MFVLEAMAAGVPVVATDVGGVKSTLGDAGVIVTVGDPDALASAIMELLADPDRLVEMSRCGQRLVSEHYSTEVSRATWSPCTTTRFAHDGSAWAGLQLRQHAVSQVLPADE